MKLPPSSLFLASLVALFPTAGQILATTLVESNFDTSEESWTQVNLGADYRYLDTLEREDTCAPAWQSGVFHCCDPDPGAWMFQAPAKFLGNMSAALDGALPYSLRWVGEGDIESENLLPHVVIISNDRGLAYVYPGEPPMSAWITNSIPLNETSGWLWMDDTTGMEALPAATRAQIAEVLANVTALRIRGEFVVGEDEAWLDEVKLLGPTSHDLPKLTIDLVTPGRVRLTWPASAVPHALEQTQTPSVPTSWSTITTDGASTWELDAVASPRFFRLRKSIP